MGGCWRLLTVVSAVLLCACGEPTVMLMAAGQDLDEGTELDPSLIVQVKVSRVLATPNAVRPDSVQPLLGQRLRIPLRKGDLLLASYFEASPVLSVLVQKKARAVTLSVSGAENLHVADHVDLLAAARDPQTGEWVATTQTQNVVVLSAGKLDPVVGNEAFPLRRVTFLMLPEEAEIALLTVRVGALHVSLRNPDVLGGQGASGDFVVVGSLDGTPVTLRWPFPAEGKDMLAGRAWAELHAERLLGIESTGLDRLLIALSQHFGLTNRLASLIVLETDAEYTRYDLKKVQVSVSEVEALAKSSLARAEEVPAGLELTALNPGLQRFRRAAAEHGAD